MDVKHEMNDIPLTSAELGYLWTTYMMNNASKYAYMHSLENVLDLNIREVVQEALELTISNINEIKNIYTTVKHPIPQGFSDEDFDLKANKLFSDVLILHFLKIDLMQAIGNYGLALGLCTRSDVKKFFTNNATKSIELCNKVDEILLNKGIFVKTPIVSIPQNIEFAHKQNYLGSILGHKRPLTTLEITQLFNCSLTASIAEAQCLGIAQNIRDHRLRDFYKKIINLLNEHRESMNNVLTKDNIDTPTIFNNQVLNTTTPPFADKLSAFITIATITIILDTYSKAITGILRKDAGVLLVKLYGEITLALKDCMDILLDKGWVEEMPKNVDGVDEVD
jgi:hypothetical protein